MAGGFSQLGLLEMTRKRTRESLSHMLCEPCPSCDGKGSVKPTERWFTIFCVKYCERLDSSIRKSFEWWRRLLSLNCCWMKKASIWLRCLTLLTSPFRSRAKQPWAKSNTTLCCFDSSRIAFVMQPCVNPAKLQKLFVPALLHNVAVGHDDHSVGMLDGGESVRNDQGGAPLHQIVQCLLHPTF